MISHLLDTNACIALIKGDPIVIRERFEGAAASHALIGTSTIALFELWYGVEKSMKKTENKKRLQAFLAGPLDIIAFNDEDAVTAGTIRAQLERMGKPIGAFDTLIAAEAIRLGIILVTANVRKFERVPGLQYEDWTS